MRNLLVKLCIGTFTFGTIVYYYLTPQWSMKKKLSIIFTLLAIYFTPLYTKAQVQDDGSVNIVTYWQKNDRFSLKINTSSTDSSNEQKTVAQSSFKATLFVTEATDKQTTFEWVYTEAKIDPKERVVETILFGKLLNKKLKIQLSDVGQFMGCINYDEFKNEANKAIDICLKEYENDATISTQFRSYKQIITTKPGFEAALLKHIKVYLFAYGYNFKQNNVVTNQMKVPNSMGGAPFDAVEKVKLTKIDTSKSLCVVETNKIVDGISLKNTVINFLKKNNPGHEAEIENELRSQKLEMSERTSHTINYDKGIPFTAFFERISKMAFENRIYSLSIETIL